MSPEVIAIVVSAAGVVVALGSMFLACFAWMIRRVDTLGARLDARIDAVEREVIEVKIAIARIEGPRRHLIPVD